MSTLQAVSNVNVSQGQCWTQREDFASILNVEVVGQQ